MSKFRSHCNELRAIFLLVSAFAMDLGSCQAAFAQQPNRRVEIPAGGTLSLPANWEIARRQYDGALQLVLPASSPTAGVRGVEARILITVEQRRNHTDALRRIASIAAEVPQPAEFSAVSSWPALHRKYQLPLEHSQKEIRFLREAPSARITVAIAMQDQLVRIEAAMAPDAGPGVIDQADCT